MKFSHLYGKMPLSELLDETILLEVFTAYKDELHPLFIDYDTKYFDTKPVWGTTGNYRLPDGKLLVLLLITRNHLWTTIRSWNEDKEKYYRGLRGKVVPVDIEI